MTEHAQCTVSGDEDTDVRVYPLSYSQQQLWFLQCFDPTLTAYNLPRVFRLRGPLSPDALERAFQAVIDRHPALRTRCCEVDGVARQKVLPHVSFSLEFEDVRSQAPQRAAKAIEEIVQHVFDLGRPPLLAARLIRTGPEEYVLACCLHHIVSDAGSNSVIAADLAEAYRRALQQRGPVRLRRAPALLGEHAARQRQQMANGAFASSLNYWNDYLGSDLPPLELPADRVRPATQTFNGAVHELRIAPDLATGLQQLCRTERCTPFVAMLAAWQVLLAKVCDQETFGIGVPNAGRRQERLHDAVGFFVTMQPFRAHCPPTLTLRQVLRNVRRDALNALDHDGVPLEALLESRQTQREAARNPLFQVLFDLRVADQDGTLRLDGVQAEVAHVPATTAKLDLSLQISVGSRQAQGTFEYNADLFEPRTIARLSDGYLRVLAAFIAAPDRPLAELTVLSAADHQQLASWQSGPRVAAGEDAVWVHESIQRQAHLTPSATALVFEETSLSYAQLNARANRLAHRLIALGVVPDQPVAILAQRSMEMVIGLLAIMKAGGAYVPLDPEHPVERVRYMLESSGARLVLAQTAALASLTAGADVTTLVLDELQLDVESDSDPCVRLHRHHLAYVIYTSGSTGRPKGAANCHGALRNRLTWMQQAYGLRADEAVLQKTPFGFDVSVWEFFWPLMQGARLIIAPPGAHREPERLVQLIRRHAVTTLHFVPSMLQAFLDHEGIEQCTSLRRIVCSGEALPIEAQRRVFERMPWARLYNLYGPTEAAIDVAHWTCRDEGRPTVPIGRPIGNIRTVVLDSQLNPAAPGAIGELYLGGVGLARGYLYQPALTAGRFVADPGSDSGEQLYRTGDRVRWRDDGQLEYLGRVDHQVKIRGFRIELGEIEAHLLGQPEIREAAAVARSHGGATRLIAYVAAEAGIDPADVRERLSQQLPDYMVPGTVVVLPRLPLSSNGKIDRRALPEPDAAPAGGFVSAQGEVEQALAQIWSQVLRVPRVGRHDNYFALGGDSILSLRIVALARAAGWRVTARQVFERPTVSQLAAVVEPLRVQAPAEEEALQGEAPLLPIQAWFFELQVPRRHHWNQCFLLQPTRRLDARRLDEAMRAMEANHDAFRLRYRHQPGKGWSQFYGEPAGDERLSLREARDTAEIEAICSWAQDSLDLERGPLLRAVLIAVADGSQRLFLVAHHLIVDGVSWRILLEDLSVAYAEGAGALLPKSASYGAWSRHVRQYTVEHAQEFEYWRALPIPSPWPVEFPGGDRRVADQATMTWTLDRARTKALLTRAAVEHRAQIQEMLFAALTRALCAWSGQSRLLIDVEGHGRHSDELDLSRTVGWFTALYPVAASAMPDIIEALKHAKETLRAVPNGGLGFGIFKYAGAREQQDALAQMDSAVLFNYLGQFDAPFDAASLWTPAAESAGAPLDPESSRAHEFTVTAYLYRDELKVTVSYSAQRYRRETVWNWMAQVQAELEVLADRPAADRRAIAPSDFPLVALSQQQLDALPLQLKNVEALYPMTPLQRGLMFHALREADSTSYINQLRMTIDGLDERRFASAWQALLQRHEGLRAGFIDPGGSALQWIATDVVLPLRIEDSTASDEAQLQARTDAELTGFDFLQPPPMRLLLLRLGRGRHRLIWTFHHVLLDGWSVAQLLSDLLRAYGGDVLPPLRGRYSDYIKWLATRDRAAARAYWSARLQSIDEPTLLFAARPSPRSSVPHEHVQLLPADLAGRLTRFAQQECVTLNTLMQAAWSVLLNRCTGQPAVVFGTTTAGRPAELPDIERLVGLFINTHPVRVQLDDAVAVGSWLRTLQEENASAREHEHAPLFEIQQWIGRGGQTLFDTLLVFENYPVDESLRSGSGGELRFLAVDHRDQAHYPLTVVVDNGGRIRLRYRSGAGHFDQDALAGIAALMQQLLEALVEDGQRALGRVATAPASVRSLPAPAEFAPVHQCIERWAKRRPAAPAVTCGDVEISYADLNARANRLAHRLIAAGIRREDKIGIALERDVPLIVATLAVLKSGAAYVPIDPAYPSSRIEHMMRDAGVAMVLTQASCAERLPALPGVEMLLMEQAADTPATSSPGDPDVVVHPDSLAYVIYTSGSTGRPKGAQLSHRNLSRLLSVTAADFRFDEHDVWTMFHSHAFDFSVWEMFGALCHGGRLVVVPQEVSRQPELFLQLLRDQRVTVLNQTPSAFLPLLELPATYEPKTLALRTVIFGGEALDPRSLRRWLEHFGDDVPALINMYGITETAVHVTYRRIVMADTQSGSSPIGKALRDLDLSVLDARLQPAPPGARGELFVAGAGLARGYLDRPGLTAERFVADPFDANGGRMYRSGDVARCNGADTEYQGRADQQVKIRGYRIELGEIEAQLLRVPEVRQAHVLARDAQGGCGRHLIAYLVADDEPRLLERLRAHMQQSLPDYMLPAAYVVIDRLPLNLNGKVDRQALLAMAGAPLRSSHVDPRDALEARLAQLWSDVLRVERVGIHDNFFELGGHSLHATRMIAEAARMLNVELPLRWAFESGDLASFAAQVRARMSESMQPSTEPVAVPRVGATPMSHAQQRLWFLWQLEPRSAAFNIPFAVHLCGDLDAKALQDSFDALIARHEVLRTRFADVDGVPSQIVQTAARVVIENVQLADMSQARGFAERWMLAPFDLEHGPLLRVALVRLDGGDHVLVVTLHHIVADGSSMAIVMREFASLYASYRAGREPELPPLPLQYADYAIWHRQWLESEITSRQLDYWRQQLEAASPLELPADRPRPAAPSHRGASHRIALDPEQTARLTALAREQQVTMFALLLAAFCVVLKLRSGQSTFLLGTNVDNRPHPVLRSLVGFFVNQLVLKISFAAARTAHEFVQSVQEMLVAALEHQDLPFDRLVDALRPQRRGGGAPFFNVKIIYQAVDAADTVELPGLQTRAFPVDRNAVELDLIAEILHRPNGLQFTLAYSTDLFEAATMASLGEQVVAVLHRWQRPGISLDELAAAAADVRERREAAARAQRSALLSQIRPITRRRANSTASRKMFRAFRDDQSLLAVCLPDADGIALEQWAAAHRRDIEAALLTYGAILFRGFEVADAAAFHRCIDAMCGEALEYRFRSSPRTQVDPALRIYTSTEYPASERIFAHNENSYAAEFPSRLLFYCDTPPASGGETPIGDVRAVLRNMDREVRNEFARRQVLYVRNFGNGLGLSWQQVFQTQERADVEAYCRRAGIQSEWRADGQLRTRRCGQAIIRHPLTSEFSWFNHATFFHALTLPERVRDILMSSHDALDLPQNTFYGDGAPIERDVIEHLQQLYRDAMIEFTWRKGDVLLLDNLVTAHARNAFTGPRRILVGMAGVESASALAVSAEEAK